MTQAWRQGHHRLILGATASGSLAVGALFAVLFVQNNSISVSSTSIETSANHVLSDIPIISFSRLWSAATNSSYSHTTIACMSIQTLKNLSLK